MSNWQGCVSYKLSQQPDSDVNNGFISINSNNLEIRANIMSQKNIESFKLTELINVVETNLPLNISNVYSFRAYFERNGCKTHWIELYGIKSEVHKAMDLLNNYLSDNNVEENKNDGDINNLVVCTLNHTKNSKENSEEKKEENIEMQSLNFKQKYLDEYKETAHCDVCMKSTLANSQLYECQKCERKRILCKKCGEYTHSDDFKEHEFDIENTQNVVCINKIVNEFDPEHFENGKYVQRLIWQFNKLEWYEKWVVCGAAAVANIAVPQITSFALHGLSVGAFEAGINGTVIGTGIASGACCFAGGAAVGILLECGYLLYRYKKGDLKGGKQIIKAIIKCVISNVVSTGVMLGCVTIGAALGTPGGPAGMFVGGIIGAIIFGILSRMGIDYIYEKFWPNTEQEARELLQKEAIIAFFGKQYYKKKYIEDKQNFSPNILKKRYYELALKCHPDRDEGSDEKWILLSSQYGVLVAICEQMYGNQNDEPTDETQETQESTNNVLTVTK